MFSLHERTQRRVCRTAFVAFCALPTIIVIGWAAYFNRPWSERDWQRSIEHTLHVGAKVEELSAPRPFVRKISKLSLTGLETNLLLIEFDGLLINSPQEVKAQQITIQAKQFSEIATALQIWMAGNDFANINWNAELMSIIGPEGQQFQFQNVSCRTNATPAGTRQIIVQGSAGPRLIIERSSSGTTHCRVESTESKLPAWLLSDTMPGARRWSKADIAGVVQLEKNLESLTGSFKGEITAIDCQDWIGSKSLLTQADLRMDEFTWESDRVKTMQGELETSEGLIGAGLLKSLHEVLYCQVVNEALLQSREAVRFDKIACGFRLNSAGLTCIDSATVSNPQLRGPGVLITADDKPMVMQPAYSNLPLANLIQLFFPLERDRLPATREATEMGDKLPLPSVK